jgi:Divergent InlB B-repeat domain
MKSLHYFLRVVSSILIGTWLISCSPDSPVAMQENNKAAAIGALTAGGNVSILGSWLQGFNHAKEPGTNRALIVMIYGEGSGNISASSVKYGNQTLTKITEKAFLSGAYSYTGAFMLNEAGIAAATTSAITVTWASAPTTGSEAVSVFLQNVNQASPIGETSTGSITGITVSTAALATSAGNLVIAAGTAANNAAYTLNNGFIRGIAETGASFGDITAAYKAASGISEVPMLTSTISQRQTMVGFVVKNMNISKQFTLDLEQASDGYITVTPFANGYVYDSGTVVTVTASAPGYNRFQYWLGNLDGAKNPIQVTITSDITISASFYKARDRRYLTTNAVHGTVSPSGGSYETGSTLTLTAIPDSGYTFACWSNDLAGKTNPTTVNMEFDKNVTAYFTPITNKVTPLTGWISGNINNKVAGNKRLMTVMVMGESNSDFAANGVTYGGQYMTRQTERLYYVNGSRSYVSLWTLLEAGVNAANSGDIVVSWTSTPSSGSSVYSSLLSNVDQELPVPAMATNALTGTSISTSPLSAQSGDLVLMSGATESNNTLTLNNGFTKQFESNSNWGDGVGGNKFGNGSNETPSFSQITSGRMVLAAMVVKKASATSEFFTLSTSAINGAITLSPPGGVYASGTVVNVFASENTGYKLGFWGGDLAGALNPATIAMTSNKVISADFFINNLILNGEFSQGALVGWEFDYLPDFTIRNLDYSLAYIDIKNDIGLVSGMSMQQRNLNLIKDQNYTLSFDAKAERPRALSIIIENSSSGSDAISSVKTLSTGMQTFSIPFRYNGTTANHTLIFEFGGAGVNDVWLANVKLIED